MGAFKTVSGPEPRKPSIVAFIELKYGKHKRAGRDQLGERKEVSEEVDIAEEAKAAHGLTESVPRETPVEDDKPSSPFRKAIRRKATAKRSTKRGKK